MLEKNHSLKRLVAYLTGHRKVVEGGNLHSLWADKDNGLMKFKLMNEHVCNEDYVKKTR